MALRARIALATTLAAGALALAGCGTHAAGATGSTNPGGTGTTGATGQSGTTSPPTTKATTTTTTVHLKAPVTVVEVGDSLGIDLGWGIQAALAGDSSVTLVQAATGDSGLVEPQFYDWPAHLQSLLTQYHPQVVVVFLGANDVQNFWNGSVLENFGTPGWKAAYGQRVASMMQEATAAGAHLLWVGMPIMQDPTFSSHMQLLDGIYESEAASHAGVTYFSSWSLFSTPSGQYTATATDSSGQSVLLRDSDGIHIATGGLDLLGQAVVAKLKALYGMP
jgi:hypothetical protein